MSIARRINHLRLGQGLTGPQVAEVLRGEGRSIDEVERALYDARYAVDREGSLLFVSENPGRHFQEPSWPPVEWAVAQ